MTCLLSSLQLGEYLLPSPCAITVGMAYMDMDPEVFWGRLNIISYDHSSMFPVHLCYACPSNLLTSKHILHYVLKVKQLQLEGVLISLHKDMSYSDSEDN